MSTMLDAKASFFKVQDSPAVSEQYTALLDHGATGWTKRSRIGSAPPDRAPCPGRIGALEKKSISVFSERNSENVVELAIDTTFDSLGLLTHRERLTISITCIPGTGSTAYVSSIAYSFDC